MLTEHAAPSSVTATAISAMVNVPVRADPFGLAVTESWTTPFPVPEPLLVIDIHARSDVADQVHVLAVVTLIESEPPAAPNDNEVFDKEYVQVGGEGSVGELLSQAHNGTMKRAGMNRRRKWRAVLRIAASLDHSAIPSPSKTAA